MEKPIIIVLDPSYLFIKGREDRYEVLVKGADRSYLNKTFEDMIQRVLDPEADKYNDKPYNAAERNIATQMRMLFTLMKANPCAEPLLVTIPQNKEASDPILVNLNDLVSKYSNRILQYHPLGDYISLCVAKEKGPSIESIDIRLNVERHYSFEHSQLPLLVKKVNIYRLIETFGDLIETVFSPKPDLCYGREYSSNEMQTATKIKEWLEGMGSNPHININALSRDEPHQRIKVGLDDRVLDYAERILQPIVIDETYGKRDSCRIDLCISK